MEGKLGGDIGEVRRVHIIYFLSHMGRAEHPHLIRVHHLTRTGVYLRDVKRWLGELRGKGMADSYAWSFKRRYKSGYVWQDLVDDDLITPLSDNEYVLKGSQIISPYTDKRENIGRHSYCRAGKEKNKSTTMQQQGENFKREDDPPSRIFSEINEEESSERSSMTDEFEAVIEDERDDLNLRRKKTEGDEVVISNPASPTKSRKSFSSHTFRSLITCGGLDTNDAALVALSNNKIVKSGDRLTKSSRDWPEDELRRARSSSRKSFDERKGSKKSEFTTQQQNIPSVYTPMKVPNCSQCGKSFKPQKMHSHMKSCRGMKTTTKSSVSNPRHGSTNSVREESALGYLLIS